MLFLKHLMPLTWEWYVWWAQDNEKKTQNTQWTDLVLQMHCSDAIWIFWCIICLLQDFGAEQHSCKRDWKLATNSPAPLVYWRLCVCDMDRLGRNEFIGEVRVALKKLKEGESKRYNMGLERIAQVCVHYSVCVFVWTNMWYLLCMCMVFT